MRKIHGLYIVYFLLAGTGSTSAFSAEKSYSMTGSTRNDKASCQGELTLGESCGFFFQVHFSSGASDGVSNDSECVSPHVKTDRLTGRRVVVYTFTRSDVSEMNVRKRTRFSIDAESQELIEIEYSDTLPMVPIPNQKLRCRAQW